MPTATYSTKQVSELTSASPQVIRQYTGRYARYLSTEATPEPGQPRRFTEADVRLIAYVYQATRQGKSHEDIAAQLDAGALSDFAWEWPTPGPQGSPEEAQTDQAMLVPLREFRAVQALLEDARQREAAAQDTADQLRSRIEELQRQLGQKEGELSALKAQRAPWWRRLFGGE